MDTKVRIQLVDLARTLSKRPELQLVMSFHSYLTSNTLCITQFWDDYPLPQQLAGFKSEVYLHCVPEVIHGQPDVIDSWLQAVKLQTLPNFTQQLFALFELMRRERACKRIRPGTAKNFSIREELLVDFFNKQVASQLFSGNMANALFAAIFVKLVRKGEVPELDESLARLLADIKIYMDEILTAASLKKVIELVERVMHRVRQSHLSDMTRSYFSLESVFGYSELPQPVTAQNLNESEMEHAAQMELAEGDNSDKKDEDHDRENLPSWHRETEQTAQTFLQFQLEQGTNSDILGDTMREMDPGDQALAVVQGSTHASDRSEFSEVQPIDKQLTELVGQSNEGTGAINKFAKAIWKFPQRADDQQVQEYQMYKQQVWAHKQKLTRTIQLTLDHKRSAARSDLLFGRLDKKLIRAVTDESSRLFYKKKSTEARLDAAFILLVDCSASMQDKMEQTKLGITLFHESLKSLLIPHCIVGFWEDANNVKDNYEPNVFEVMMDFESSLRKSSGPSILDLQAQQDNRDGFAIRMVSKYLAGRHEKNRVLLVFSDGEPAAAGYNDNGILDAHQAVGEVKRLGIDVVGLYLGKESDGDEQTVMMQNIYGNNTVVVPGIDDLSQMLAPVLRKLLLKNQ